MDLTNYFNDDIQKQRFPGLYATPLIPTQPNMHLLGTSQNSAELAAQHGLPFVTALMGKNKIKLNNLSLFIVSYFQNFIQTEHLMSLFQLLSSQQMTFKNQRVRTSFSSMAITH